MQFDRWIVGTHPEQQQNAKQDSRCLFGIMGLADQSCPDREQNDHEATPML